MHLAQPDLPIEARPMPPEWKLPENAERVRIPDPPASSPRFAPESKTVPRELSDALSLDKISSTKGMSFSEPAPDPFEPMLPAVGFVVLAIIVVLGVLRIFSALRRQRTEAIVLRLREVRAARKSFDERRAEER